jgi:hypothetical protein
MDASETARRVASHFRISEPVKLIERTGDGHIHHSYRCTAEDGAQYILQQINDEVFHDPLAVTRNIELVVKHVRAMRLSTHPQDATRAGADVDVPEPVAVRDEESGTSASPTLIRLDREWWRVWRAVPDTVTGPVPATPDDAHACGIGFGSFLWMTAEMAPEKLHVTIPDFHNMELRLQQLSQAVTADRVGRVAGVRTEIDQLSDRAPLMRTLSRGLRGGTPRVTHNDTKFTNILLDSHDRSPRAVIDLDTVMPGSVAYDFGDGARSGACTAAEDTPDPREMLVNVEAFDGYADGFLSAARLGRDEREVLEHGAAYMTMIMAVRFLTDYIDGDRYYHIETEDHNLRRVRAQLALLHDLEAHADHIRKVTR